MADSEVKAVLIQRICSLDGHDGGFVRYWMLESLACEVGLAFASNILCIFKMVDLTFGVILKSLYPHWIEHILSCGDYSCCSNYSTP